MEILFDYESLISEVEKLDFDFEELTKQVVLGVIEYEKVEFDFEVSITIVDNEEIRLLNKKHRNKDYATDVLSFPMETDFTGLGSDDNILLGDIVISLEKAIEQAESYNHSIKREIGFLVAHSMLHLLGYDHLEEVEEKEMIKKQEEVLNSIGLNR